jgi:hypothetical protein
LNRFGFAASCTITNTETSTTFTVNKVYSPSGPTTPVTVTVTCSSGTWTPPSGPAAPPASPFVTTVKHFNVTGSTCSATEGTAPTGYTKNESACTSVTITSGVPASCTITNTLIPSTPGPTPNPSAVGGLVDVVTGGSSGSGSSMSWLAVLVLAAVAMGGFAGGMFAVVRKRS